MYGTFDHPGLAPRGMLRISMGFCRLKIDLLNVNGLGMSWSCCRMWIIFRDFLN